MKQFILHTQMLSTWFQVLVILVVFSYAAPAQSVQDLLFQSDSKGVHWSVSVRNSEGNVLEEWNADKWMVPASNMKLITSAAALHEFPEAGHAFRVIDRYVHHLVEPVG